jgi:hypothetical protein
MTKGRCFIDELILLMWRRFKTLETRLFLNYRDLSLSMHARNNSLTNDDDAPDGGVGVRLLSFCFLSRIIGHPRRGDFQFST